MSIGRNRRMFFTSGLDPAATSAPSLIPSLSESAKPGFVPRMASCASVSPSPSVSAGLTVTFTLALAVV